MAFNEVLKVNLFGCLNNLGTACIAKFTTDFFQFFFEDLTDSLIRCENALQFFNKFLKDSGILDELEELGIQEGDTVRMYGLQFDYYK